MSCLCGMSLSLCVSATLMLNMSEIGDLGVRSPRDPIGKCLQRVDWWHYRWRHVTLRRQNRDVIIQSCRIRKLGSGSTIRVESHTVVQDAATAKRMKIDQYCQQQRCKHFELEQFLSILHAFTSRGFVSDSWAFSFFNNFYVLYVLYYLLWRINSIGIYWVGNWHWGEVTG